MLQPVLRPAAVSGLLLAVLLCLACGVRSQTGHPAMRQTPAETFVFAEDSGALTSYWLADAIYPSVRRLLLQAPHRLGWQGEAAVAPNGRWLAYTLLPASTLDPDAGAELWLAPLGGQPRRLASGVDLRSMLIWSPASSSVTFARVATGRVQLWRQPLNGAAKLLTDPPPGTVVVPAGYDREGKQLIVARLSAAGVALLRIGAGGMQSAPLVVGASPGRDFAISPDARRVAYLEEGGSAAATRVRIVDLQLGRADTQPDGAVGLAWRSNGALVTGFAGDQALVRSEDGTVLYQPQPHSFAQPLAWSPSGRRLALRVFTGGSAEQPQAAQDALIDTVGALHPISASGAVRFVGWVGPHGA